MEIVVSVTSFGWRRTLALFSVMLIAAFAQCATICLAAQCEAPQKASGCHHQEEPKPEKVCKDLSAVLAGLQFDISLPEAPLVFESLPETRVAAARAEIAPDAAPTIHPVLRI